MKGVTRSLLLALAVYTHTDWELDSCFLTYEPLSRFFHPPLDLCPFTFSIQLYLTKPLSCMRRLQSNLAYLASISDRPHKPVGTIPPCPAIMDAPPPVEGNAISDEGMAGLRSQYEHLRSLYPDVGQRPMNMNQMRGVTAGGQVAGGPMSSGGPGGAAGAMRV